MPRPGLFRRQGSADEVDIELTGYEWLKIFRFMSNKWLYFATLLLNMGSSGSPYLISLIQGRLATVLIDTDFESAEEFVSSVNHVSSIMLLTIFLIFVVDMIKAWAESSFLPQFQRDLRVSLMRSFMEQDITYYDEHLTGVILSRLQDDVEVACSAYTEKVLSIVRTVFQWFSGLIISISQSWKVTIIMCCCLPFYAMSQVFGNKVIDKLWLTYNERNTRVSAKAEEILTSFRTVRSFDSEMREYHNYKERLMDVHEVVTKTSFIHGVKEFLSTLIHWGMASFVLYFTGKQAAEGEIEPGTIVTIMSIINNWSFAFAGIFSTLAEFQKTNVSAAKLLEIFDRKPLVDIHSGNPLNKRLSGRIEFNEVCFRYPTRNDNAVDKLSFVIEPGETVAFVGESGCGKSTTLQLIQRLYDITSGAILLDGIDIRTINPLSLRSQIAIVPQNPVMFSMNVKDNIRYGKPHGTREDVLSAAKIANAHKFVTQLKDGYRTKVQQNSLSGGQKQRICIARAVMIDAPILLLDEATAALDTESERLVQEALDNYRQGKTAIIVAHRLATVRHASRIFVMDKGTIVETGTHEELLDKSGFYAHLVQHQLQ